jgi:hypothetical protein
MCSSVCVYTYMYVSVCVHVYVHQCLCTPICAVYVYAVYVYVHQCLCTCIVVYRRTSLFDMLFIGIHTLGLFNISNSYAVSILYIEFIRWVYLIYRYSSRTKYKSIWYVDIRVSPRQHGGYQMCVYAHSFSKSLSTRVCVRAYSGCTWLGLFLAAREWV